VDKHKCLCCDKETLNEPGRWETCNICNWEDDPLMRVMPDYNGDGMDMTLNEARKAYKEGRKIQ
jgi:hypothetical protein